jgi:UDP-N-acetylmuramoylalanine--D-glutamate ligase
VSEQELRARVANQRCLVVGASVSGRAAARVLGSLGAQVVLADDAPARRRELAAEAVEVLPLDDVARQAFALVVVSPGVRPERVRALELKGEVIGELELGYLLASAPITAITGTNGKSTVTTLTAAMLGEGALAAGNLGTPLSEVAREPVRRFVVEASSFQLLWSERFHAEVAGVLNLTPNHLDYHGSFDAYRAAKARLVERLAPGDVLVVPAHDDAVAAIPVPNGVEVRTFAVHGDADYWLSDGVLLGPGGRVLCHVDELARPWEHEIANVLAAWALAEASGGTLASARVAALAFRGLPHRLQVVLRDREGVLWVDDSKATTPEATLAALGVAERVVLLAGGRTKGTDFRALRAGAARLRGVVAIGEAAAAVEADLADVVPWLERAGSMEEAVRLAAERAEPGDVVLLAPGATSWDWYRDYAERGDDFARWVRALREGGER